MATPPRAQLISKSTSDTGANDLIVEFPCMPDVLDLARSAQYNVKSNPVFPDGLHIFQSVSPLEIPVSFKLSAFDDEFNKGWGAINLLRISAALHAMVLPIKDKTGSKNNSAPVGVNAGSTGGTGVITSLTGIGNSTIGGLNSAISGTGLSVPQIGSSSSGTADGLSASNVDQSAANSNTTSIAFPSVCELRIIFVASGKYPWGIKCTGYVKNVSCRLREPWLTADDGSYNLPSSGEFSFTFVHVPSYRNRLSGANPFGNVANIGLASVFAADVRDNLYSTLAYTSNLGDFNSGVLGIENVSEAPSPGLSPIAAAALSPNGNVTDAILNPTNRFSVVPTPAPANILIVNP